MPVIVDTAKVSPAVLEAAVVKVWALLDSGKRPTRDQLRQALAGTESVR